MNGLNAEQMCIRDRLSGLVGEDRDNYLKRKRYVARLQPKYYFKLQKSLEHSQHGILSSLIIYKHLLYFLESDYSLNEDYMFDHEDSRQYYIRREILRAIASHTCHDIYQNDMLRFSFLLIPVSYTHLFNATDALSLPLLHPLAAFHRFRGTLLWIRASS